MIELTVKEFMEGRLSVPLFMEIPANPPKAFVVLHKGDTSREDFVNSAMFVADSYAPSMLEAARLNEQVVAAFDSLTDLDTVSSSKRGGDYSVPDTQNKRYRYQAVFDITYYD